jgi:thymidylate synthase
MQSYSDLVKHVLAFGTRKENRTGVDTISTFGYYYEHDLQHGFPLLTTKSVSWKNIVVEMLWFLSGQTDISILKRHGCKFWDAWADPETGKVPSAYGNFWRQFPVHEERILVSSNQQWGRDADGKLQPDIPPEQATWTEKRATTAAFNDQIAWALSELRKNAMSRRMVVSAWAPSNAQTSKLPPCHSIFMLNVQNANIIEHHRPPTGEENILVPTVMGTKKRVCLHLTQRSCDVALGVPYNIASYALLLSIFGHLAGIEPGIFGHSLVDAHVYTAKPDGSMAEFDHIPGLQQQIARQPRPLPKLTIDPSIKELADIERLMGPDVTTDEVMRHFQLEGYTPWPAIPFKVAV